MGLDLLTELGIVIDCENLMITWDNITQPMKKGELNKQFSHCEDLFTAMMAPPIPVFEELLNDAYQSEHIKQAKSWAEKILDDKYEKAYVKAVCAAVDTLSSSEQQQLLSLLRKFEHLFDRSLGDFRTDPLHLELK